MKIGLEQVGFFFFNGVRLTVSAGVLLLFAYRERSRGVKPCPELARHHLLVYGLLVGAAYQVLFLLGVGSTTSGNTALIIATVPMWTALLARVFLGESLHRLSWCGLFISLVGTVIVALQKGDISIGQQEIVGNLFVLCAALVWSTGTVYSRPLLTQISPVQLSATSATLSLPVHLLLASFCVPDDTSALSSPGLWLIIVYSGVLSSGLSQPMWNYGVRHAGAAHAAVVQNLIPLIAIIAAWCARGESATPAQVIGGVLILAGLATMRVGRRMSTLVQDTRRLQQRILE